MKAETHCTCLSLGVNLINHQGDVKNPMAYLITFKIFLNSNIATPGSLFMTSNLYYFYFNNLIKNYEYMRSALDLLPKEIILQYNLRDIDEDGYVYFERLAH